MIIYIARLGYLYYKVFTSPSECELRSHEYPRGVVGTSRTSISGVQINSEARIVCDLEICPADGKRQSLVKDSVTRLQRRKN